MLSQGWNNFRLGFHNICICYHLQLILTICRKAYSKQKWQPEGGQIWYFETWRKCSWLLEFADDITAVTTLCPARGIWKSAGKERICSVSGWKTHLCNNSSEHSYSPAIQHILYSLPIKYDRIWQRTDSSEDISNYIQNNRAIFFVTVQDLSVTFWLFNYLLRKVWRYC